MDFRTTLTAFVCLSMLLASDVGAQDAAGATDATNTAAAEDVPDEELLSESELDTLVGPVALFPDTLLVQVLVASASPLDVVKANRLVEANPDSDPGEIGTLAEDEEWDESVQVLAEAFPDVLSDMADHLEWTESMGTAMLAQSDDVLAAIQRLRQDAVETGALESGEEQQVEVDQDQTIVIQPTDPQVVYVPQYQAQQVWPTTYGFDAGDALLTGAVAFGTYALIDDIFDDDDDWHGYWGCHDCGGWNGRPIIRDPDVDLDIDGNVNIGNRVDIDRDKLDIDREKIKGEWNPDKRKRDEARNTLKDRRQSDGRTKMTVDKNKSRGDAVRDRISQGGDRDLAAAVQDRPRPGNNGGGGNRPNVNRPGGGNGDRPALNRPGGGDNASANRPSARPSTRPADRPQISRDASRTRPDTGARDAIKRDSGTRISRASAQKPAVKKPAVKKPVAKPAARPAVTKPTVSRPAAARPAVRKPSSSVRSASSRPALQKSHSSHVSRASSSRGHKSISRGKRR